MTTAATLMSTTPSTICSDFDVDAAFAEIIAREWPKLEGRQTPNALSFTPGDTALGGKACELGRRSASRVKAFPWQAWSLDHIMSKNADGTWTHPECCLIVPRQNGKSLLLSLRVLYGLFKLGENIIFSAQQWETAKSLWKRTWAIVKTTPWMLKRVESKTCSQGRGTIVLASGAQVVFTTRSANAGRGLDKIDLEIYDESYDLTEADMAALSPTKMAAEDPQTIYTSSAVNQDQHPNGNVLASVRRRGLAGEEGLFFAEWMAPEELDRADPDTWRWANPSFGVIQTVKKLRAELNKFSTEAGRKSFDVEYLGRGDWPVEPGSEERELLFDLDEWAEMANPKARLTGPIALGLDMDPSRKWVSIGAAQRTTAGLKHVEVGIHEAPTEDLVAVIVSLVSRWDPCALVIDKTSPAMSLLPDLVEAGIEPETTTAAQMAQACGGFYDDAVKALLCHTGDPLLTESLQVLETRELSGGGIAWARTKGGVISPIVAVTLARWGLVTFQPRNVPPTKALAVKAHESAPAGVSGFADMVF
ncbi:hypothetical protein [Hoyosella altamirensis]|uniref:hypothetical protein n=1 Tax=Hoyosella altamirensis TaxID=616997 RepID=UPI0007DB2FB9|nr:hypothetical protein [Hoyosella altamirensis]